MTAVATEADLGRLAAAEQSLLRLMRLGIPADAIATIADTTVHLEPLHGVAAFEPCQGHGCSLFVDNAARDEQGFLTCSEACAESIAEEQWEADEERRHQRDVVDAQPAGRSQMWLVR